MSSIPPREEVKDWGEDEVQQFVKQAGMADCCDILKKKKVDGLALLGMNDAVLQLWSRDMKIMQIKKLSKLVSQLNSSSLSMSSSYSPTVVTHRKHRKVSQGSVNASDNDWGSDFEDATDNENANAQVLKVEPNSPTIKKSSINMKISANQLPKPYKPPATSAIKPVKTKPVIPEYSNVKKNGSTARKSQVLDKISKFSTPEEKPATIKNSLQKPAVKLKTSQTLNEKPKSAVKSKENSSSSVNSQKPPVSSKLVENSKCSTKSQERLNSPSIASPKSPSDTSNNPKSAANGIHKSIPQKQSNGVTKPSIPNKLSAFKTHPNNLQKEQKEQQKVTNSVKTKSEIIKNSNIKDTSGRVTWKKSVENSKTESLESSNSESVQSSKQQPAFIVHVDRSSQIKKVGIETVDEYYEIPQSPQNEKYSPRDDAFSEDSFEPEIYEEFNLQEETSAKYLEILDNEVIAKSAKKVLFVESDNEYEPIDRTDCLKKEKESPQLFKTKEAPQENLDAKTSPSIKLNGMTNSYATVKTTKEERRSNINSQEERKLSKSSSQTQQQNPVDVASRYPQRALPLPPSESNSHIEKKTSPLIPFPWYINVDRRTAERIVRQLDRDGGFLVRDSKHGGANSPFTLTVYNNGKVFNINIRNRPDGRIALGKEKPEENTYPNVEYMVEHHMIESLKLTAGDTGTEHSKTTLNFWPDKNKL